MEILKIKLDIELIYLSISAKEKLENQAQIFYLKK